uniref:G-protein coupled receptors family 1 profile domain-containing protein n=1 Tax=Gouania willdenowi TaxID=441366 RepID=A0A8C5ED91_GOUWI
MENLTLVQPLKQPIILELEGFDVPAGLGPLLFFLTLLTYLVVLLGNGVVMWVIVMDQSLHRPMYVMVCHLTVCDLIGGTALLPRIMLHLLTGERRISYGAAITQAVFVHTYAAAFQTILALMAYDRYIAVCKPLRYHSIMTSARLHLSCALAWFIAILAIFILFMLHLNEPLCGRTVQHIYCSNRTILALACGPTPVNNLYGLSMTWCLSTGVFLIVFFSYAKILSVTTKQSRSESSNRSKAVQTCASHLVVYLVFEIATLILITLNRFPSVSKNIKKLLGILYILAPTTINPLVYGLVSKDLRASIIKLLIFRLRVNKRV